VTKSRGKSKDEDQLRKTGRLIQEERVLLKAKYRRLFEAVSEILFRNDPIGINFESNTDEYEPEVGTILPRLRSCASASDVRTVIYQEFVRWFDPDIAGPEESYETIAQEVWSEWHRDSG
jgi:hypothetical protein